MEAIITRPPLVFKMGKDGDRSSPFEQPTIVHRDQHPHHHHQDTFLELRDGHQFTNHSVIPAIANGDPEEIDIPANDVSIARVDIKEGDELTDHYGYYASDDVPSEWLDKLMAKYCPGLLVSFHDQQSHLGSSSPPVPTSLTSSLNVLPYAQICIDRMEFEATVKRPTEEEEILLGLRGYKPKPGKPTAE